MPVKVLPNDDHSRLSRIGAMGADAPMTLKEACRVVFKDAVSVATLMAEYRRGNLVIYKIGRQYFTTWRELNEMLGKCCVPAPAQSRHATSSQRSSIEEAQFALAQRLGRSRRTNLKS